MVLIISIESSILHIWFDSGDDSHIKLRANKNKKKKKKLCNEEKNHTVHTVNCVKTREKNKRTSCQQDIPFTVNSFFFIHIYLWTLWAQVRARTHTPFNSFNLLQFTKCMVFFWLTYPMHNMIRYVKMDTTFYLQSNLCHVFYIKLLHGYISLFFRVCCDQLYLPLILQ